jgi:hypothetical protein
MRFALMVAVAATAGCTGMNQAQRHLQLQEVLGTVAIGIVPLNPASLPQPPIDLVVHIKRSPDGPDVKYDIADGSAIWELSPPGPQEAGASLQNFRLMLAPGDYSVSGFYVRAKSLWHKLFFLPTGGPNFTVPESGCVYIGRINVVLLRLPPGSVAETKAASVKLSASVGEPLLLVYLPWGSLVPEAKFVDQPQEYEHSPAGSYSKQLLAYARQKQCAIRLAE